MNRFSRRGFIKSSASTTALGLASSIFPSDYTAQPNARVSRGTVQFTSDGLNLTPLEYSQLLLKLAEEKRIDADYYSLGGSIQELESK